LQEATDLSYDRELNDDDDDDDDDDSQQPVTRPFLGQFNPVHTIVFCFVKIQFNSIVSGTLWFTVEYMSPTNTEITPPQPHIRRVIRQIATSVFTWYLKRLNCTLNRMSCISKVHVPKSF
jgi:hypothetical protein